MLNRGVFQLIFGICLLLVAIYLLVKRKDIKPGVIARIGQTNRTIIHRDGTVSTYSFNLVIGIAIAFGVGFIGGLLGIGGGILHVPARPGSGFPCSCCYCDISFRRRYYNVRCSYGPHSLGEFTQGIRRAAVLSAGAVIGAQFGARLSHKVSEAWIVRYCHWAGSGRHSPVDCPILICGLPTSQT